MRKITLIAAAAIASAALGAGATIAVAGDQKNDKKAEKIEKIGAPENCVRSSQIRSTNVIDDRTIDFKMIGGKTYRNTLPSRCPGLGFEESFSYRTSVNQLCNVDIIRVLRSIGGQIDQGAACGLGKFQEIKKIKAAKEAS